MQEYSIILMDEIKKEIHNCWTWLHVGNYWQALRTYGAIHALTDLYENEIDELPDDIDNELYFVPVTKYLNDSRDKIKIIIEAQIPFLL